jgi:hypothetical protein
VWQRTSVDLRAQGIQTPFLVSLVERQAYEESLRKAVGLHFIEAIIIQQGGWIKKSYVMVERGGPVTGNRHLCRRGMRHADSAC